MLQAVCTVTFTVEADIVEDKLDNWLQVTALQAHKNKYTWELVPVIQQVL